MSNPFAAKCRKNLGYAQRYHRFSIFCRKRLKNPKIPSISAYTPFFNFWQLIHQNMCFIFEKNNKQAFFRNLKIAREKVGPESGAFSRPFRAKRNLSSFSLHFFLTHFEKGESEREIANGYMSTRMSTLYMYKQHNLKD